MKINEELKKLANVDPLKEGKNSSLFVGHPFSLDFPKAGLPAF